MNITYNLKPIIDHDVIIEHPLCMYEMKNIHDDGDSRQRCRIVPETPLPEVAALEERQEKILTQLAELKEQVLNLCSKLNENSNETSPTISIPKKNRSPVSADLVLNTSPLRPCYSLLALKKLWNDVDIRISPFVHSTIPGDNIPQEFQRTHSSGEKSILNVSLIWKNVLDTELIVSGIQRQPVLGESNFLRYLVRLIDNETYEKSQSILETIKIDKLLDISNCLVHQSSPKEQQATLLILTQTLASNRWFTGKNYPGIVDIALWSALKQCKLKKLSSSLDVWYKKCDELFLC